MVSATQIQHWYFSWLPLSGVPFSSCSVVVHMGRALHCGLLAHLLARAFWRIFGAWRAAGARGEIMGLIMIQL
jgi:hypothetical protein